MFAKMQLRPSARKYGRQDSSLKYVNKRVKDFLRARETCMQKRGGGGGALRFSVTQFCSILRSVLWFLH